MKQSRRDVLKTGAGLAGAGLLSSLAGCGALSDVPVIGDTVSGSAYYSDWLVDPGAINQDDYYDFTGFQPTALSENDEFSDSDAYDLLESSVEGDDAFGPTDISFEDIEELVSRASGDVYIASGSFTTEDIVDELEDQDYEEESELDTGERVMLSNAARSCYAVSDDHIIAVLSFLTDNEDVESPAEPSYDDDVQTDVRSISYGETVTGELNYTDPGGRRGEYEPITFDGSAGDIITIDMVSNDDTYLMLDDPDGNTVAENDDYSGFDSRIEEYTLEQSGEYTIIATSYSSYDNFDYQLSLTRVGSADDLVDSVTEVANVQNGDTTSYMDESEDAADLVNALGGGNIVTGSVHEEEEGDNPENGAIEASVAEGLSFSLSDDQFDVTGVVVFDSENDFDDGDIEDWAEEGTTLASEEIDDIEVSQDGRVGTFSGVCDADELF